MTLEVGMTASRTRTISDEDLQAFARASGDTNAIHLDDAYAAQTPYKKRIVYGMLSASLISAVLGDDLPGLGTVYLSQELHFNAPVFIGDTITATVVLTKYRADRRIASFDTTITNQDGAEVITGKAVVIAPEDR